MSENYVNLTIAARNAAPRREEYYPYTWIVISGGKAVKVHVAHDDASRPYVEGRYAA